MQYSTLYDKKVKELIINIRDLMIAQTQDYDKEKYYDEKIELLNKEINKYTKLKILEIRKKEKVIVIKNKEKKIKKRSIIKEGQQINKINDIIFFALNNKKINTKQKAKYFVQQYLKKKKNIDKTIQEVDLLVNKFISKINKNKIQKYKQYCFNKKDFSILKRG